MSIHNRCYPLTFIFRIRERHDRKYRQIYRHHILIYLVKSIYVNNILPSFWFLLSAMMKQESIGVAGGVGGWAEAGVNAGLFSR